MAYVKKPGDPEVSLTAWLDPVMDYFAKQAGIPTDQYSAQVGGEGIATALEVVADLVTVGWLNKAVQFIAGLIASSYAIWGKDVPTRLRRELIALGTHELLRIVNPKPSEIREVQESLSRFIEGLKEGNMEKAMSAILRKPGEFMMLSRYVPPARTTQTRTQTPTVPIIPSP